jgi:hypothetical protein
MKRFLFGGYMLIAMALLFLIPLALLALASRSNPDVDEDTLNWQRATERAMANPHAWPYGEEQ